MFILIADTTFSFFYVYYGLNVFDCVATHKMMFKLQREH